MAVAVAVILGFTAVTGCTLGNFWVDLTWSVLWILLPLLVVLALFLAWQSVSQTPQGAVTATGVEGAEQIIARGPAAAQIAIEQLGTNGGGFFGVKSEHPFENPTIASNLAQCLPILLIRGALCFLFGQMAGDRRQGWAIFAAMAVMSVAGLAVIHVHEGAGNPSLGLGANMESKDPRFGAMLSALWAASFTATSNGSVNAMHDSFTPLSGRVLMVFLQIGALTFCPVLALGPIAEETTRIAGQSF